MGGATIEVIMDHKSLVSIFSDTTTGSTHTYCIKHGHHNIQSHVIWQLGSTNQPDYLSKHATLLSKFPKSIQY